MKRSLFLALCLLSAPSAFAGNCTLQYRAAFNKLDTNHNNYLEAEELKRIPAEYRKAVLVGIDANNDQKIDAEEYIKYRQEDKAGQNSKGKCG